MDAFENVVGYDGIKEELNKVIDIFNNADVYKKIGTKTPRGILLYGRPGLGKTLFANDFIKACNVDSFSIINNKRRSDLVKEINDVFIKASSCKKAIIFIDDIDKFGTKDFDDEPDIIFSTIQTNIESIKDKDILVIATANNYDGLPNSLVRKGRFDIKINVENPNENDSKKILEYYLKTKKVNKNFNYDDAYKIIGYSSCANLESFINEAAILAAYKRKDSIDIQDIVEVFSKEYYEIKQTDSKRLDEEVYATSLHEAGHTVIAEALNKGSVGFVSVSEYENTEAKGFTKLCKQLKRRPENILLKLGGKTVCELFYQGRCASGCQSDLYDAFKYSLDGIIDSGTSGIGNIHYSRNINSWSNDYKNKVEALTQSEIERYMFIAKDILLKNKNLVFKIAEELNKKHYLLASDIEKIEKEIDVVPYVC